MGRRDRERTQRIKDGEEAPRSLTERDRDRAVKAGVAAVKNLSVSNQIQVLADSLHSGRLSPGKLQKALKDNADKEMSKGARKLAKKNKPVTVDALMEEYRGDKAFQELASEIGLDEDWFVVLAETECEKWEGRS